MYGFHDKMSNIFYIIGVGKNVMFLYRVSIHKVWKCIIMQKMMYIYA